LRLLVEVAVSHHVKRLTARKLIAHPGPDGRNQPPTVGTRLDHRTPDQRLRSASGAGDQHPQRSRRLRPDRFSGDFVVGERRADAVAERSVLGGETSDAGVRSALYDAGSLDSFPVDELFAGEIDFLSVGELVPEVHALAAPVGVDHVGEQYASREP
jgi:hypothetical protein